MKRQVKASDMWNESIAGLAGRPLRTILTLFSVSAGVTALVATLGISRTAGNQILDSFNALEATQISVEWPGYDNDETREGPALQWSGEERLMRLNGVVAAGSIAPVPLDGALITSNDLIGSFGQSDIGVDAIAASPGLLSAVDGELLAGRFLDHGDNTHQRRVVVLGSQTARALNITRIDNSPAIFIGDDLYTVIGILSQAPRRPSLLHTVLLPPSTAHDRFGVRHPASTLIQVDLGAAQLIADQAPVALNPNDGTRLSVKAPPDLTQIRDTLESSVNVLFLALGLVSVVIGAIGITNTTLVSVLERRSEIGLRRALGARRHHIAGQILAETGLVGLSAGILGATAGILITIAVSASNNWTPLIDPEAVLAAPVGATLVALIAGLSPAVRATRIHPAEALRG